MDNKEIKDKIENDFGWLTPDEKQKLNSLLISVWNDAVVASAQVVDRSKVEVYGIQNLISPQTYDYLSSVLKGVNTSINDLKLKL